MTFSEKGVPGSHDQEAVECNFLESEDVSVSPPEISDEIIINIIKESPWIEDVSRKHRKSTMRKIFQTFCSRTKHHETVESPKQTTDSDDAIDTAPESEYCQYSEEDFTEDKSTKDSIRAGGLNYDASMLYDISQPITYSEASMSESKENLPNDGNRDYQRTMTLKSVEHVLSQKNNNHLICVNSRPPTMKSSSRKLSIFAKRSRNKPENYKGPEHSKTKKHTLNFLFASTYIQPLLLLTQWRMKDSTFPEIIMDTPSTVNKYITLDNKKTKMQQDWNNFALKTPDDYIFLYLDVFDSSNTKVTERVSTLPKMELQNMERMLNYPYKIPDLKKKYSDYWSYLTRKSESSEKTHVTEIFHEDDEVNRGNSTSDRDVQLTVKSLHLEETLSCNALHKNKSHTSNPNKNYVRMCYKVSGLARIQTGRDNVIINKTWNLWLCAITESSASRLKYHIFGTIKYKDELYQAQVDLISILDNEVRRHGQQLFMLQEHEIPAFHGKQKVRDCGEYVYVIPEKGYMAVLKSMTFLLLSGKLDYHSKDIEAIGIGWRWFQTNRSEGYYLTLYLDDRNHFDGKKLILFLSNVKLLIPSSEKSFFNICKTVYPGQKDVVTLYIT